MRAAVVAGTEKLTAPMPDPVAPPVIVIQASVVVADHELLVAVQTQLTPLITDTALVLPIDDTDTAFGVTVAVHCASTVRTPATKISPTSTQKRRSVIAGPLLSGPDRWSSRP